MSSGTELAAIIAKEMSETGKSPTYERLLSIDFKYKPVSPEQFLMDDYNA